LAQMLYCDLAMREFGDLDLLVRPGDVHRACDSLRDLGYDKQLELSPLQEKEFLRSGYEYVFGRGAERNLVELQWSLLPRFYAVDVNVDDWFRRSVAHDFEGCPVRVLRAEDQMLFLCLHAAKHQWAQLGMIRDIAALSRLKIDWGRGCDEARRLGITRILVISLLLAQELLGAELPVNLATLPDAESRKIAAAVGADVAKGSELRPESPAYFRFMMRLREHRQDRVRFLWRLAVTPSVGEWQAVQLPDAMFPLYFGVRLFRLMGRAAD